MGLYIKKIHLFIAISTLASLFLFTVNVNAYPDFIGIGYTACITCHFNGAGGGALNDYGRSLFASEIAAKPFWRSSISDEELSQKSGLIGSKELPYWIRPSLKYRGLSLEKNPGSKEFKTNQYYQMQRDLNFHFPFNENQTLLLALNLGLVEDKEDASPSKTFSDDSLILSREYYLRAQLSEVLWFYIGLMDKAFGIRHPDHTAVNRWFLGLGQNHQVHGVTLHYVKDNSEFFFNPFVGNLHLGKSKQYSGVSFHYEYEPGEKWRLGFSLMRDQDSLSLEKSTLAFFLKRGIEGGHSVLFETGLKDYLNLTNQRVTSFYLWTQSQIRLLRGYYLQSVMEYLKSDIKGLNSENLKFGVGFLFFPIQRLEWRVTAVSSRIIDPSRIEKDSWNLLSQVHLSF